MDGTLVPWADAKVHILTHTLHYGLGVFEGIRCYQADDGTGAVFRLQEHVDRLFESAHIVGLEIPYSREAIFQGCLDTVRANGLKECYIRPLAYMGEGAMGLFGADNPVRVSIAVWRWGTYLGDEGLTRGIRAKVSSYARPGVNISMNRAKVVGHYVNSILAKREVVAAGYDEAILLDPQGYVGEASGENLFYVRKGEIVTPTAGGSMLMGITRDTVLTLASELKIPVRERPVSRDELYVADEIFLTGTAAEVTPVREIDGRTIGTGARGAITNAIQERYFASLRAIPAPKPEWRAPL